LAGSALPSSVLSSTRPAIADMAAAITFVSLGESRRPRKTQAE